MRHPLRGLCHDCLHRSFRHLRPAPVATRREFGDGPPGETVQSGDIYVCRAYAQRARGASCVNYVLESTQGESSVPLRVGEREWG